MEEPLIQNLPWLYLFLLAFHFSSLCSSMKCLALSQDFGWVFFRKSVLLDHFHGCQHLVLMEKVKIVLWLSIYLFRCVSGESSSLFFPSLCGLYNTSQFFRLSQKIYIQRGFLYIFTQIPWCQALWDIDYKILITKWIKT